MCELLGGNVINKIKCGNVAHLDLRYISKLFSLTNPTGKDKQIENEIGKKRKNNNKELSTYILFI